MPYGEVASTVEEAKKKKWAAPLPDVQLYARILGSIQYQCPDCGNLNSNSKETWRRAKTRCKRCKHRFRVGVGFTAYEGPLATYLGPFRGHLVNKIEPDILETASYIPGRIVGTLEYVCPRCDTPRSTKLAWDRPCVTCCEMFYVRLLLYKPSKDPTAITCPLDWSVPYVATTHKTLPAPQIDSSTGIAS